jgi:hypothetical protein
VQSIRVALALRKARIAMIAVRARPQMRRSGDELWQSHGIGAATIAGRTAHT